MFDPNNPRIQDIDFDNCKYVDCGSFGHVVEVYPGFVLKTGDVDIREVEQQEYLASHGLALPVLDYTDNSILTYRADSVGEIGEDEYDDFFDFKEWIEQEWYSFALSPLDDHNGNWGKWTNESGEVQFVWLDCDPDWDCDKCDGCNLAIGHCDGCITRNGRNIYCETCHETLTRCVECDELDIDGKELENGFVCSECLAFCAECGDYMDDETTGRLCEDCHNKSLPICLNCDNRGELNNIGQCVNCQELQPLLPYFENWESSITH